MIWWKSRMKKYLQKLGQDSYKASLERVDTKTKNKVFLYFFTTIFLGAGAPKNCEKEAVIKSAASAASLDPIL